MRSQPFGITRVLRRLAVGYKEVIRYLDGAYDLEHAIYRVQGTRLLPSNKPPGTDVFMIFAGYPAMPTTCSSAP